MNQREIETILRNSNVLDCLDKDKTFLGMNSSWRKSLESAGFKRELFSMFVKE